MLVNLKASVKDKKWFEEVRDSLAVNRHKTLYSHYKKFYELINNDISKFQEEVKQICNPLAEFGEIEDSLKPYNKLKNKLEILNGEYIRRPNVYRVMLTSSKLVQKKSEEMHQKRIQRVNEDLMLEIEKLKATQQNASEEEINQIVEQQRERLTPKDINYKNFMSSVELYKNKILKYAYIQQRLKMKQLKTLKDILTTDHVVVKCGISHGMPYIRKVNVLHVDWDKREDEKHIEKSDWVREITQMTVADFITEYSDRIPEEDICKILENKGIPKSEYQAHLLHPATNRYEATLELLENRENFGESSELEGRFNSNYITIEMLEFKAFREVIFFTYYDEYGEPITAMLDNSADIIPKGAEKVKVNSNTDECKYVWTDDEGNDYEAIIMYVPRRYEYVQADNELILYRECPDQPDNINNPYLDFELSYKGICVSNDNAKPQSLIENAAPYQFQIYAVKHLMNREIAAYQSFERHVDVGQIPDQLAEDAEGNPIKGLDPIMQNEIIARKTRTRYFDGGQTSAGGLIPSTRSAGVHIQQMGSANEIILFQNLISSLDLELGLSLGIPPAREAQAMSGTNVTDNRQSLIQAAFSTQIYFYMLDYVWCRALDEYLYLFDTCVKNTFESNPTIKHLAFEYLLPDGSKELLEIFPDQVNASGVGLYVSEFDADKLYIEYMQQYLHAIAQNAGQGAVIVSQIIKMISQGSSAEEINKEIIMYEQSVQERQRQMAKDEEMRLEKAKKEMLELKKFESQLKVSELVDREKERNIGRAIEAERFAKAKDIDQNNINDDLEARKYDVDKRYEIDKEKLEIERAKLQILKNKTD